MTDDEIRGYYADHGGAAKALLLKEWCDESGLVTVPADTLRRLAALLDAIEWNANTQEQPGECPSCFCVQEYLQFPGPTKHGGEHAPDCELAWARGVLEGLRLECAQERTRTSMPRGAAP